MSKLPGQAICPPQLEIAGVADAAPGKAPSVYERVRKVAANASAVTDAAPRVLPAAKRRSFFSNLWGDCTGQRSTAEVPLPKPTTSKGLLIGSQNLVEFIRAFGRQSDRALIASWEAKYPDNIHVDSSADGSYHRVDLVGLGVDSARLDLRGITANIALNFFDCRLGQLDLSYSVLHSLGLFGIKPGDQSTAGTKIDAIDLQLAGDLFVGRAEQATRIEQFRASGLRARKVLINGDSVFDGKSNADIYWRILENNLTRRFNGHTDDTLDTSSLDGIDPATLARVCVRLALFELPTLDLSRLRAETVHVAIESDGAVKLRDARVDMRVTVSGGSYRGMDFKSRAAQLNRVIGSREAKVAREALDKAVGESHREAETCLDLTGLVCGGELAFGRLGLDHNNRRRVSGHVVLANVRCHTFTDDETWWNPNGGGTSDDMPAETLTYDLKGFLYDYFGAPDPEDIERSDATEPNPIDESSQSDSEADELKAVKRLAEAREKARAYSHNFGKRKALWLQRTSKDGPFDAQPWTQCATAMRRAGWRDHAETVLFEREIGLRETPATRVPFAYVLLFGVLLFLLFVGWTQFPDWSRMPSSWAAAGAWTILTLITFWVGFIGIRKGLFDALWYSMLKGTIGFGYKPGLAILQSLGIILMGVLFFSAAYSSKILIPNPDSESPHTLMGGAVIERGAQSEPSAVAAVQTGLFRTASYYVASSRDYRDCEGADKTACEVQPLPPTATKRQPAPEPEEQPSEPEPESVTGSSDIGSVPIEASVRSDRVAPFPEFNPLMYSVDVFIPFIDFSQGSYWVPGREPGGRLPSLIRLLEDPPLAALWLWYWLQIAAGWWYTSVLIAGLAGLLEKRE